MFAKKLFFCVGIRTNSRTLQYTVRESDRVSGKGPVVNQVPFLAKTGLLISRVFGYSQHPAPHLQNNYCQINFQSTRSTDIFWNCFWTKIALPVLREAETASGAPSHHPVARLRCASTVIVIKVGGSLRSFLSICTEKCSCCIFQIIKADLKRSQ